MNESLAGNNNSMCPDFLERGEKNMGVQNLEIITKALGVKTSKLLED